MSNPPCFSYFNKRTKRQKVVHACFLISKVCLTTETLFCRKFSFSGKENRNYDSDSPIFACFMRKVWSFIMRVKACGWNNNFTYIIYASFQKNKHTKK